ncbi:MAG: DHH family phosphoesterase [Tannerellaceae bacterium]|jgi:phosphoesterase RecJ-like protein|nr:DHH family phosphoesterase [Tannerellaceae bacterium]
MLEQVIQMESVRQVRKRLNKAERCVVVAHVSPDGDAVGSSLALNHFLTDMGKSARVILPDDFPHYYRWLSGSGDILIHRKQPAEAEQLIYAADIIFCLDLNEPRRLGALAEAVVTSPGCRIMVDHHLHPAPDFCHLVLSCPTLCSTGEMVFRLICRMGMYDAITLPMAECIYTGMMTDTGAFTYNSGYPDIYTIIGELIKKGIDKDRIYRNVYQVYSEQRLRLMGYLLYEKMRIYPERQTALMTLTNEEKVRFSHRTGDTEGFVNLPLGMSGISFSAFLKEEAERIRLSFRSVGDFPSNLFAARFGGGGHKNAAGGVFEGTMEEAVQVFEEALTVTNPAMFV